jgi:hypothetical protein
VAAASSAALESCEACQFMCICVHCANAYLGVDGEGELVGASIGRERLLGLRVLEIVSVCVHFTIGVAPLHTSFGWAGRVVTP